MSRKPALRPFNPDTLPPLIRSLQDISDRYDGYLIDQWGVLHDGVNVFPAALAALERLKMVGKRVIILSNSGRSGPENTRLMAEMGIGEDLYSRVLSAGDDAVDALAGDRDRIYQGFGRRIHIYARPDDQPELLAQGYQRAASLDEADFLYVHSMPTLTKIPQSWIAELHQARARNLPLVCANPDLERVNGAGEVLIAPGAIARLYQDLGGTSHYHGKPWPRIYRTALRLLDLPSARVLAIGDSLAHDVRGAGRAGISSLFVVDGIHRERIDLSRPESLSDELDQYPEDRPDMIIPFLS